MRNPPPAFSATYDLITTLDPLRMPQTLLAETLGLDVATLIDLTDEGIIPFFEGKYPMIEAIGAYVRYIKNDPALQGIKHELNEAKLKKLDIDNQIRLGALVPVSEAETAFLETISLIKMNIDGLPPRVANEFAGISNAAVILQRLREELDSVFVAAYRRLQDFADYRPRRGLPSAETKEIARRVGKRTSSAAAKRSRAGGMAE